MGHEKFLNSAIIVQPKRRKNFKTGAILIEPFGALAGERKENHLDVRAGE